MLKSLQSEIDPLQQSKVDTKMEVAASIASAMDSKGWNNLDLQKVIGAFRRSGSDYLEHKISN